MLKIQRSANGRVVFTLSGRIEAGDVKELRELLALETAGNNWFWPLEALEKMLLRSEKRGEIHIDGYAVNQELGSEITLFSPRRQRYRLAARMFERYTEKARRVIFFARYEASNYGSPYIETEHLLLGLLREDHALANRLAKEHIVIPDIRAEIERRITRREPFSTSVEVPLSDECKRILNFAADAAAQLGHRWVETEHLLLGILRIDTSMAAQILISRGFKSEPIQEQVAKAPSARYEATAAISAQVTLETFLAGLKSLNSEQLIDYFAKNAEFIDASGQRWNREELWKGFDTIFAHYAKKNASYLVETTLAETRELFVAVVLWKNALLASEERTWVHRMTAVLLVAADDWKILLLQVTGVMPSLPTAKKTNKSVPG